MKLVCGKTGTMKLQLLVPNTLEAFSNYSVDTGKFNKKNICVFASGSLSLLLTPLWLFHLLFFFFYCGALSVSCCNVFIFTSHFSFSPAQTHFIILKTTSPVFPPHSFFHDFVFSSPFLSISLCSLWAPRTCWWMVWGPEGVIISRNTSLLSWLWGRTRQTRPKQSPQLAPEKPWLGVCGPLPSSVRSRGNFQKNEGEEEDWIPQGASDKAPDHSSLQRNREVYIKLNQYKWADFSQTHCVFAAFSQHEEVVVQARGSVRNSIDHSIDSWDSCTL